MAGPSGSTPILQLPYPVLGDSADVPRDIEALAEKLDGLVQTVVNPPLVTALPSVPVDGQECYFASAAAGVIWHLRYRAAISDASKWECLGGQQILKRADASRQLTTPRTAYTALPTDPLTLTVPLPGVYDITTEVDVWHGQNDAFSTTFSSYTVGATPANDAWAATVSIQGISASVSKTTRHAVAAPLTLSERVRSTINVAGNINFASRRLIAMPVRVG